MSTSKSNTSKKIFGGLALLIVGGAFGYGIGHLFKESLNKETLGLDVSTATMLISLLLSIFLVLLIHELGHVLGGISCGNRFALLTAGPLKVENENGQLRWRFNRNLSAYGGLAITIPTTTDNFKRRRTITVAGGPAASLLLATLALLPVFLLSTDAMPLPFRFFLICLGFLSLTIFVVTIIPLQSGGFMSDGMQLINIYRDNPVAHRYEALLQLIAELQQGKRPKEISEEQMATVTALGYEDTFGLSALHYQYYRALDQRDWTAAARCIELFQDKIKVFPQAFQKSLWVEVAIYYSLIAPNPEKAQSLYDQLSKYLAREKNKLSTNLLHLAMARLQNQPARALSAYEAFQKTLHQDGISVMYQDLVEEKMGGGDLITGRPTL